MSELANLRKSRPRDFWKHFKSRSSKTSSKISLDEFKHYFENLSADIATDKNNDAESFNSFYNFDNPNTVYPELDDPITVQEIINAVKLLKRNKSCGSDNLLNEYFIESVDILA